MTFADQTPIFKSVAINLVTVLAAEITLNLPFTIKNLHQKIVTAGI
jgi:hypothetical protein